MNLSAYETFVSMDWGYNAFGCALWWVCLPDGHYHIAREYKFKGQTAAVVGDAIKTITRELRVKRLRYVVADPAMWGHTGAGKGESIAETLSRQPVGLPMKKGDNTRQTGWQRLHELFQAAPDGKPWLTIDTGCTYLRRTIPAAVSDKSNPDDVDTTGDDHGLDALRYGAMSRPAPTRLASTTGTVPAQSAGALFAQAKADAERAMYAA